MIAFFFNNDLNHKIAKYSEAQTGCPQTLTHTFDDIEELLNPYFKIVNIWIVALLTSYVLY